MTLTDAKTDQLREKYGARAIDAGPRVQPGLFERRLELRDKYDQHFTKTWLDFDVAGVAQRQVLDDRTKSLIRVGQFTMTKNESALDDAVRAGIAAGVNPREILEVILQCFVYGGNSAVDLGLEVFDRVVEELGLVAEAQASQLPVDGHDTERSLDAEAADWHEADRDDPRREALMAKHGWQGVSTGLRMRPKHHLEMLDYYDHLDSDYAHLWENAMYHGMYSRWQIDDKTRLLCMVGNCIAVGEAIQGRAHMLGAMRQGATAREVMEVIFQSVPSFGNPNASKAFTIFVKLMADAGRLDEIGNPTEPTRKQ